MGPLLFLILNGSVQVCGNSIDNALQILHSHIMPAICCKPLLTAEWCIQEENHCSDHICIGIHLHLVWYKLLNLSSVLLYTLLFFSCYLPAKVFRVHKIVLDNLWVLQNSKQFCNNKSVKSKYSFLSQIFYGRLLSKFNHSNLLWYWSKCWMTVVIDHIKPLLCWMCHRKYVKYISVVYSSSNLECHNSFFCQSRACLSWIFNTMIADDMQPQGSKVSAGIVLTYFSWNIQVSMSEGLIYLREYYLLVCICVTQLVLR